MEYVCILQWTPFAGLYLPIAEWQLQEAEWELRLNLRYYYEHAIKTNRGFLYPVDIADRIIEYWSKKWSFAKYRIEQ